MTDTPPAQNGADAAPGFRILAQFIRDLSFENPRAPNSLRGQAGAPQIEMNVEMNARARTDDLYESDLKLTVSAKSEGETMFHIELLYGGLFQLSNFPEEEIEAILWWNAPGSCSLCPPHHRRHDRRGRLPALPARSHRFRRGLSWPVAPRPKRRRTGRRRLI